MSRYKILENVSVAVFKNFEEIGKEDAIFPNKTIEEVIDIVRKEYGDEQLKYTDFYSYKKNDVYERYELSFWEKNMLIFRLMEKIDD